MKYLIAILLPPLAVFLEGKPFQAMLNLFLTLCMWIPGMIHALFIVSSAEGERRNQKLIQAIKEANK